MPDVYAFAGDISGDVVGAITSARMPEVRYAATVGGACRAIFVLQVSNLGNLDPVLGKLQVAGARALTTAHPIGKSTPMVLKNNPPSAAEAFVRVNAGGQDPAVVGTAIAGVNGVAAVSIVAGGGFGFDLLANVGASSLAQLHRRILHVNRAAGPGGTDSSIVLRWAWRRPSQPWPAPA